MVKQKQRISLSKIEIYAVLVVMPIVRNDIKMLLCLMNQLKRVNSVKPRFRRVRFIKGLVDVKHV